MNSNISNILIEASKYPEIESKQIKKLTKLIKFVFPESNISLNKKGLGKIKIHEVDIIILVNPETTFSADEIHQLKGFVRGKGHLVLFSQPPNITVLNNLNSIFEEYHFKLYDDQVIRTTYKNGYYHPKVAYISDGAINRSLPLYFKKEKTDFQILLPYGHTISCGFPCVPIMGTGSHCYPVNRPVCGVYDSQTGGKVVLCGSYQILLDKFIDSNDNSKFIEYLFQYLKNESKLNELDIRDPGINEYQLVPNIKELSTQFQYGIEESESVDSEVLKLHKKDLFHIGTDSVSTIKQVCGSLQIAIEPLELIRPEFSAPVPLLKLALFHPTMRTTLPAPLELFDLDEHCASDQEKLGMLVNKCIFFSLRH
eukprot:NODE_1_length_95616_cov_0.657642.p23 type:complete len:368 gc:universal NODE_1_length_95616_cov_0.657642:13253-14356(+)